MVTAIKQMATVGKDGKIELYTPELIEGTKVEVILLVDHQDETEYLLSNAANAKRLLEAIANIEKGEGLVTFSIEEWDQKYRSISSSTNAWNASMSEINSNNPEKQNLRRQRINELFTTWDISDSEEEQTEALKIIESVEGVSI